MTPESLIPVLGVLVVVAPCVLTAVLGVTGLARCPLSENATSRWTQLCVATGFVALLGLLVLMLASGRQREVLVLGNWIVVGHEHFTFELVFDRLSVPFALLSYVLVGTIGAFAHRYLHREPGFRRFFMLYAVFLLGMLTAALAGTIETLFVGWEFVGLSSALLVAYFQERRAPVVNGQRVWSVYRLSDAAFLVAAVAWHHVAGTGEFEALMGAGSWPDGGGVLAPGQAALVGSLLLVAVAGKSALIPFSGWLPRAMEGPTPSSAVFYGALSVHLGVYLLLRVSPLLAASPALAAVVVALGLATALYASLVASVQADIKTALAFASLTQVGIITAEIGFGLHDVALVHILGHASLRALQILRAPSLLHDYHTLENAVGGHLHNEPGALARRLPHGLRERLYRFALLQGGLDLWFERLAVAPALRTLRACGALERRWTRWLSGASDMPAGPSETPPGDGP